MRDRVGRAVWATAVFVYVSGVAVPPAQAYIDPGTGSFIFQVVAGAVLGVGLAVKVFWRRIVGLVRGRSRAGAGPVKRD